MNGNFQREYKDEINNLNVNGIETFFSHDKNRGEGNIADKHR